MTNDKILNWSKLKAFADDKIDLNEKLKLVFERIENKVGKGEDILVSSNFSFSRNVFKSLLIQGHYKSGLRVKE